MARRISMPIPSRGTSTHAIVLTEQELSRWAGRTLTVEELDRLAECIQHSSIPEAVATIVDSFGIVEDQTEADEQGELHRMRFAAYPDVVEPYHAPDCDGSACDGCGWIDAEGTWHAGPCPKVELSHQAARAEG